MITKFIYLSAVIFVISLDLTDGKLDDQNIDCDTLCNLKH